MSKTLFRKRFFNHKDFLIDVWGYGPVGTVSGFGDTDGSGAINEVLEEESPERQRVDASTRRRVDAPTRRRVDASAHRCVVDRG